MSNVVDDDVQRILGQPLPWESLRGSNVLVTGAAGMVGQYLVRSLLGLHDTLGIDVNVSALARGKGRAQEIFEDADTSRLTIVDQDVAAPLALDEPFDVIIHAASPSNPAAFREDPVGVMQANVLGAFNTLELARLHSATFCLISTMEVYGQVEGDGDTILNEDTVGMVDWQQPRSVYPESKRSAEALAGAYGLQHDVDYKIGRMTHTYGPGMSLTDSRVQTQFMRSALAGEDIVLQSDGSLRRTYTYISDAIAGVFYLLLKDDGQRVYNIANDGAATSIRELAELIIDLAATEANLEFVEASDESTFWSPVRNSYCDVSRLQSLGWSPDVSLRAGFARTLAHHSGG